MRRLLSTANISIMPKIKYSEVKSRIVQFLLILLLESHEKEKEFDIAEFTNISAI